MTNGQKKGSLSEQDALKALSQEDFYGLIMIDQAGIPRSQSGDWRVILESLPFAISELAVISASDFWWSLGRMWLALVPQSGPDGWHIPCSFGSSGISAGSSASCKLQKQLSNLNAVAVEDS